MIYVGITIIVFCVRCVRCICIMSKNTNTNSGVKFGGNNYYYNNNAARGNFSTNEKIIVGTVVGGCVLIFIIAVIIYEYWEKLPSCRYKKPNFKNLWTTISTSVSRAVSRIIHSTTTTTNNTPLVTTIPPPTSVVVLPLPDPIPPLAHPTQNIHQPHLENKNRTTVAITSIV